MVGRLFPDPFLKNQDWAYLWINSLEFYTPSFYCMPSWGLLKYIETKLQACLCLIWSSFKKQKEVWMSHFLHDFWRKMFLCYINWPNFIVWVPFLCEILGNMCVTVYLPGCGIINFEINFLFLIKPLFLYDQKVMIKFKYFEKGKSF